MRNELQNAEMSHKNTRQYALISVNEKWVTKHRNELQKKSRINSQKCYLIHWQHLFLLREIHYTKYYFFSFRQEFLNMFFLDLPSSLFPFYKKRIKKIDASNEVRTPRVVEWSPSRGPVDTCWVRFVRIPTTILWMVGLPHATNKVDQALPSKESLRESSIPNRV